MIIFRRPSCPNFYKTAVLALAITASAMVCPCTSALKLGLKAACGHARKVCHRCVVHLE